MHLEIVAFDFGPPAGRAGLRNDLPALFEVYTRTCADINARHGARLDLCMQAKIREHM